MSLSHNDLLFFRLFALAQLIPEVPAATLFARLAEHQSGALTLASLSSLTLDEVSNLLPELSITLSRWQTIMACLKGELPTHLMIEANRIRLDQLKVAFASTNGIEIDAHFGGSRLFFIYSFDEQGPFLSDIKRYQAQQGEMNNEARISLLTGCHILFCCSIGGPAAAKVIRQNIHPIKVEQGVTIRQQLGILQQLLANKLPPWLAKNLNRDNPLLSRHFD